jgi:hypothetical protein
MHSECRWLVFGYCEARWLLLHSETHWPVVHSESRWCGGVVHSESRWRGGGAFDVFICRMTFLLKPFSFK